MAVTASSGNIVLTGTENDLTNFTSSLANCTLLTLSNSGTKRIAYLSNTAILMIQGTLNLDPLTDNLYTLRESSSVLIQNNGTFKIGSDDGSNFNEGLKSTGFYSLGPGNTWHGTQGNSGIRVASGGTFDLRNSIIELYNGFQIRSGGTFTCRNGEIIVYQGNAPAGRSQICWFRDGATIDIDGLVMSGGELLFKSATGTFNNIERKKAALGIFPHGINAMTLENLKVGRRRNTVDICIQTEGVTSGITSTTVINSDELDLIIVGAENNNDARNRGSVRIQRRCQLSNIQNNENENVTGSFFIRDVNNSQRKNLNSIDDTADKTYFQAVTAGSSNEFIMDYLIVNVAGTNTRGIKNTAPYTQDFRGTVTLALDNTVEDIVLTGYLWSYLNNPVQISFSGKGLDTNQQTSVPLKDTNIEESNVSVISALTGITLNQATDTLTIASGSNVANFQQIYEYGKYAKTLQANIEYPSLSDYLCTKSGNQLNFGALNIQINKTLSAGSVSDLITTGAITLGTGVSVPIPYADSTADSSTSFVGLQNSRFKIYNSSANADGDTSGGNTAGVLHNVINLQSTVFRYNYVANTTYYWKLFIETDNLLSGYEEIHRGNFPAFNGINTNAISVFGSNAQLAALQNSTANLETSFGVILSLIDTQNGKFTKASMIEARDFSDAQAAELLRRVGTDVRQDNYQPSLSSLTLNPETLFSKSTITNGFQATASGSDTGLDFVFDQTYTFRDSNRFIFDIEFSTNQTGVEVNIEAAVTSTGVDHLQRDLNFTANSVRTLSFDLDDSFVGMNLVELSISIESANFVPGDTIKVTNMKFESREIQLATQIEDYVQNNVSTHVLDATLSSHVTSGTVGKAISDNLSNLERIIKYHNNDIKFFSDSAYSTQVVPMQSRYMVLYDDDGTTVLKQVRFKDASGTIVAQAQATQYEEFT